MNIKKLLEPVVDKMPEVLPDHEVSVLQEIPVETLYFALKDADNEVAHWTLENARSAQIQGIIDLDCWTGDQFLPERFLTMFHLIARCSPQKIQEYMQEIDPEVIVRSLMEFLDVVDFDPQEPPSVAESNLVLSPDSKYALLMKDNDPNLRESLLQWLNKLSAADLDLMRRHLESCKWEQKTEIEEFAYGMKKGRLEDMGFVDRHEALGIYSHGRSRDLKKQLLDNPLEPKVKVHASEIEDVMDGSFLPDALRAPLSEAEFFGNAVRKVDDPKLQELILMESFRCINIVIIADDQLHESIESIRFTADRARRYLDLGLFFLSDGDINRCAELLRVQPLREVLRLGWLLIRDLTQAASTLRTGFPESFWGLTDSFLIQKLKGRHPELFKNELSALGCRSEEFVSLEAISKCAERLATLGAIGSFYKEKLESNMKLHDDPLAPHESFYSRLLTAFARQSSGLAFSMTPLKASEWTKIATHFDRDSLDKLVETFVTQVEGAPGTHMQLRFADLIDDLANYLSKTQNLPKAEIFAPLRIQMQDEDGQEEASAPQAEA